PTAFDSVLERQATNFCTEYERFGTAVFYAGRRFAGNSIFPDAPLFPVDEIKLTPLLSGIPTPIDAFFPMSLAICTCGYGADTSVLVISRNTDASFIAHAEVTSTTLTTFTAVFDSAYRQTFCDTVSVFIPVLT